jgi:eukaryotic-like serine/threonine-protein kinase
MAKDELEQLGRYQLLALLATGGMAEIYLARQTGIKGFERLVVIKRILPHLARTERFVEMFFDEARIAAQLNHPNIVQIYDLGQEEDEFYISMEYLEGESLGYLVREARRSQLYLPAHLSAGIVAHVCDGLDYAHKFLNDAGQPMEIVHRDVSPHNIIVLFSGGVKLVDFGIAKAASKMHQTRVGTMKGKLTYMSPEQCLGEDVDARSDVFSLGIVFWELLTRRRLFKRKNEAVMIQAVLNAPIPLVREIRPDISIEIEAVVYRALQRDKAERFQTAAEMGAAIRECLRHQGVTAGIAEIAEFAGQVFAERARTKRRLLEDIKTSGPKKMSMQLLKPETDESLPSSSRTDQEISDDDVELEHPTQKQKRPIKDRGKPSGSSVLKNVLKIGLPIAIVVCIVALWWAGAKRPPDVKVPTSQPLPKPQPIEQPDKDPKPPSDRDGQVDAANEPEKIGPSGVKPTMLSVASIPAGCQVEIDGVDVPGLTPLSEVAVDPAAKHLVSVRCKKYKQDTKYITGQPGEKVAVEFKLKRIEGPKPKTGMLRLNTVPWSEVYLGKRKLGMTPLLGVRLPVGTHTLTATNKNRGLVKKIKVTIRPGKTTTLRLKLDK